MTPAVEVEKPHRQHFKNKNLFIDRLPWKVKLGLGWSLHWKKNVDFNFCRFLLKVKSNFISKMG